MIQSIEGQYFFARHRRCWGVWKVGKDHNGVRCDDFVRDFIDKEEARKFVYQRNGWLYEPINKN